MKPAWQSGAGFSALAIAGALAFNYPLLALFDRDTSVFGIPLQFLHIFVVWALVILGLAVLAEHHTRKEPRRKASAGALAARRHSVLNSDDADTNNDVAAPASGRQPDTEA